MKRLAVILGMVLGLMGSSVSAAELESPADGAVVSGIGFISGWKCHAGSITVRINGGGHIPLATEQPRADTRLACGTLTNGFITQVNWNFLGAGTHTAVAYDDGVAFARSTFTVGTADEEFLRGVEAECLIPDFPAPGETGRFVWNESTQHLELTGVSVTGSPEEEPEPEEEEPADPADPDPYPLAPYLGIWDISTEITHGCSPRVGSGAFRITTTSVTPGWGEDIVFTGVWRYDPPLQVRDLSVPRYELLFSLSPDGEIINKPTFSAYGAKLHGRLSEDGSGSGTWYDGDSNRACRGVWQATRR